MAVSPDQLMRPLFADQEHYFKAQTHFASKSDNLKVLQEWANGDFSKIMSKLKLLLKSTEDELRILGVGSGAGEVELIFMKQLLSHFMNIKACVLEPCHNYITKYQDLTDEHEKDLEGVVFEWRQQTLEEYGKTCKYLEAGLKFHFISVIQSIYYVDDLDAALQLLRGMLEPGGALIITIATEDTGFGQIWKTLPDLVQPTSEEGAAAACPESRPKNSRNSTYVKEALDRLKIDYITHQLTTRTDIGSCLQDESSPECGLLLDFISHTVNFRDVAPEKLQKDFVDCLKEKCVQKKDNVTYFLSTSDVYIIYG